MNEYNKPKTNVGVIIALLLAAAAAMMLVATLIVGTIINVGRGLSFWGSTSNYSYPEASTYTAANDFSVSAATIGDIEIDWIAGNVTVTVCDGDEIKVGETSASTDPDDVMRYKIVGNTLVIKFRKSGRLSNNFFLNNTMSKNLTVEIPADIAEELGLDIDSVSAGVVISGLSFGAVDIDTVSGNVHLNDADAEELGIDTVSGDVRISSGQIAEAKIDSVSGSVSFGPSVNPKKLKVDTVSGWVDIGLQNEPKELNIDTVSGSVTVDGDGKKHSFETEYPSGSGKVDVDTMSGDVTVSTGK